MHPGIVAASGIALLGSMGFAATAPSGGGSGLHMAWMWLFGLVPAAALLILGLELAGRNERPPREGGGPHAGP